MTQLVNDPVTGSLTQNDKNLSFFKSEPKIHKCSASVGKNVGFINFVVISKRFLPTIIPQGPVAGDSPHHFRPNQWACDGRYEVSKQDGVVAETQRKKS